MKDINIKINRKTRLVCPETDKLGNELENLQERLVFSFEDEFVDGQAELIYSDENYVAYPVKIEETYVLPIKEIMLTKYGKVYMQLKITEGTDENKPPKFRSNVFPMYCGESLIEEVPEPEQYPSWLDKANAKLNQLDEAIDKCVEEGEYAKEQGDYAKEQGDYAKNESIYAKEQGDYANEKGKYADDIAKEVEGKLERGEFDGADFNYEWRGTELGVKNSKEAEYEYVNLQGASGVFVGEDTPDTDANVWVNPEEEYDTFDAQYVVFDDGEDLQYKYDNNKFGYDDTEINTRLNDAIDTISDVENSLHQEIISVEEIANSAYDLAHEAEIIASGKSTGHVFETKQEMETWLSDTSHKALLNVGDHLYIKNDEEYDHWWDGEEAQELQTQKVDLSEYYLKNEVDDKLKGYALTSSLISAINSCEPKMASEVDYVIETGYYGNGESGYRKYKNGIIEQWGVARTNASETEFTMHKPHINQNFSIFIEPREQGNFFHYATPSANQKFKCRIQTRDSVLIAVGFQWRSYGRWK